MPVFDAKSRTVNIKIVYYGPGLSGKTTNLQFIHSKTNPNIRGKLVSLATETERTLFFDFIPMTLGKVMGFNTRLHLYTVPGQSFYNLSRKLILKNVDGIVFVADSAADREDANIDSLKNLKENLQDYERKLGEIPHIIQYNKRDLDDVLTVKKMRQRLNHFKVPDFEAIATKGDGVFETLREMGKIVFEEIKKQNKMGTQVSQK